MILLPSRLRCSASPVRPRRMPAGPPRPIRTAPFQSRFNRFIHVLGEQFHTVRSPYDTHQLNSSRRKTRRIGSLCQLHARFSHFEVDEFGGAVGWAQLNRPSFVTNATAGVRGMPPASKELAHSRAKGYGVRSFRGIPSSPAVGGVAIATRPSVVLAGSTSGGMFG